MAIKEVRGTKDNLSRGFKDIGVGFLLNAFTKDAAVVKNENAIKQSIKNLVLKAFTSQDNFGFKRLVGSLEIFAR